MVYYTFLPYKILLVDVTVLTDDNARSTLRKAKVVQHARRVAAAAPLQMGGFWDNRFHGGGSADTSELDEMYEEQQAIVRRRQGLDTAPAVKRPRKQTRKVAVKASKLPTQQHMDDTYAEDLPFKMPSMPKMPWDK